MRGGTPYRHFDAHRRAKGYPMHLHRKLTGFSAVSLAVLISACGSSPSEQGNELAESSAVTSSADTAPIETFQFDIDTTSSSIKVGSRTFAVGKGTLTGSGSRTPVTDPTGASCPFTINAAVSNATFEKVQIQAFPPVSAQLELCGDIAGRLTPAGGGGGTIDAPAAIKVKLSGFVNCEIPCTPIKFTTAQTPDGQDY